MKLQDAHKLALLSGAVLGIILAVVIIIAVIMTGNTFGQRCAKVYTEDTQAWNECIARLSKGGAVS